MTSPESTSSTRAATARKSHRGSPTSSNGDQVMPGGTVDPYPQANANAAMTRRLAGSDTVDTMPACRSANVSETAKVFVHDQMPASPKSLSKPFAAHECKIISVSYDKDSAFARSLLRPSHSVLPAMSDKVNLELKTTQGEGKTSGSQGKQDRMVNEVMSLQQSTLKETPSSTSFSDSDVDDIPLEAPYPAVRQDDDASQKIPLARHVARNRRAIPMKEWTAGTGTEEDARYNDREDSAAFQHSRGEPETSLGSLPTALTSKKRRIGEQVAGSLLGRVSSELRLESANRRNSARAVAGGALYEERHMVKDGLSTTSKLIAICGVLQLIHLLQEVQWTIVSAKISRESMRGSSGILSMLISWNKWKSKEV